MEFLEFEGINSFLVGVSKLLLKEGSTRVTRGLETVELNHPIVIKIKNPLSRIVTIKERNWNYILPYAESLWIASGRNDMNMIGHYLKRMYEFSDDNISMRAAYGPRLRFFSGISSDYQHSISQKSLPLSTNNIIEVDQFAFIEKVFEKDPFTRRAIISITDPAKDYIDEGKELKNTKDFPCTNNLQFIRRKEYLDLIIHMRSNDFFWGATAVNIFNFTFIQEYFAQILGLEVGHYYHIVNNLHYYKRFQTKVEKLATIENCNDESYLYSKKFNDLKDFDRELQILEKYEDDLRNKRTTKLQKFNDEFFNDWAKIILSFYKKDFSEKFSNPILNQLIYQKI